MNTPRRTTSKFEVAAGLAAGVLALAVSAMAVAGPSESRTRHESVVVTGIDRTNRTATLQNADGETRTVDVPADMKSYDTLKVGDHIDIDYYESVALSLLPEGTKPTTSESTSVNRMGQGVGVGTRSRSISATVVKVDARNNKVTFRGPTGKTETVEVDNPEVQKRLPMLRVGQVVQMTYTEALAASIRPSSPGSNK
jgi:hypothetical protein